jgi:predicted RNA-binding protein YlxR (DUF448 family)
LSKRCREPERTCVGCRVSQSQASLVRYVLSPQQQLLVDYRQKLPGRGVYTCCDVDCIIKAVERKQLQRAFKVEQLQVSSDQVVSTIIETLLQRIENLLGMARKSGQAVSGSSAILNSLKRNDRLAFVLLSDDVSTGIANKVLTAAESQRVEVFQMFSKGRIGEILGKGERSVAALQAGKLANAIKLEVQRYKRISREI